MEAVDGGVAHQMSSGIILEIYAVGDSRLIPINTINIFRIFLLLFRILAIKVFVIIRISLKGIPNNIDDYIL